MILTGLIGFTPETIHDKALLYEYREYFKEVEGTYFISDISIGEVIEKDSAFREKFYDILERWLDGPLVHSEDSRPHG